MLFTVPATVPGKRFAPAPLVAIRLRVPTWYRFPVKLPETVILPGKYKFPKDEEYAFTVPVPENLTEETPLKSITPKSVHSKHLAPEEPISKEIAILPVSGEEKHTIEL